MTAPSAQPQLATHSATVRPGVWNEPWPWALLAVVGLVYFVWAGSSYDPRKVVLWALDKYGWIAPVPGLGHLWIAAALLLGSLSMVAYRAQGERWQGVKCDTGEFGLRNEGDLGVRGVGAKSFIWQAVAVGIIVVVALDVRLAVLRWWMPLPLNSAVVGARFFKPQVVTGRGLAIVADMLTLGILLLVLAARGRNLWLAAAWAFHPLALMPSTSPITYFLPAIVLIALGWRLQPWLRQILTFSAASGCVWWIAHLALAGKPFNGLFSECFSSVGIEGRLAAQLLVVIEVLMQSAVMIVAWRRGWDMARTLGHIFVAWAIVSPIVMPADILAILVLLPLAWTRAGWVLSCSVIGVYAIVPLYVRGTAWHMPAWVTFLVLLPALVVEIEELIMG